VVEGGPSRRESFSDKVFMVPSTSTFGARLAQEIYDEFLVCKICLESYQRPKCLSCLHTFCEDCIESHVTAESTYKKYTDYREFTCPLCRKRTQLAAGGVKRLPDNFLVASLSEIVVRQRPPRCGTVAGRWGEWATTLSFVYRYQPSSRSFTTFTTSLKIK